MAWNPGTKLIEAATKIAKEKHPDGFTRKQLLKASKEVNDGFSSVMLSSSPYKKVKTYEDINNLANHMSEIDGHYPRGMSNCFVVGINGDCGFRCPVFLSGDCEELGEWTKDNIMNTDELDEQEKHDMIEAYFE